MKKEAAALALAALFLFSGRAGATDTYYETNYVPSAPKVGQSGSTAVYMASNAIVSWADGYTNLQYGTDVSAEFQTPQKALGPAVGDLFDIVSLGRGGQITLTFAHGIGNRAGPDFAVFENAFSDTFLELAYVEVSSDGTHFVRFPNYSTTPYAIGAFGELSPQWVFGLAGKYRQGYGTPFDLDELRIAYNAQLAGKTDFSPAFASDLTNNFPLLDLNHIIQVRLIDIVGDGSALDSRGEIIYDPYPTTGSAGFDLDAIGVLNEFFVPYADWAASHAVSTNGLGDADGDGVVDFQEYRMGGNPNLAASAPTPVLAASSNGTDAVVLEYDLARHAAGTHWIETSDDLSAWTNAAPLDSGQTFGSNQVHQTLSLPADASNRFYRLVFERL